MSFKQIRKGREYDHQRKKHSLSRNDDWKEKKKKRKKLMKSLDDEFAWKEKKKKKNIDKSR